MPFELAQAQHTLKQSGTPHDRLQAEAFFNLHSLRYFLRKYFISAQALIVAHANGYRFRLSYESLQAEASYPNLVLGSVPCSHTKR